MAHPKFDFSDLTPDERTQLEKALWDSLEDSAELLPLTDRQKSELDRRLEAYGRDGDPGHPFEHVLDQLEPRLRERGA